MTVVVVKLGGHALDSLAADSPVLADLANDVVALREAGTDVVVVHGGGPQIAQLLDTAGLESRFCEGLRITDVATMAYVAMALSYVNVRIVAALNHAGLACAGLTGADATLARASSLGAPWDRAGASPAIDVRLIESLWRAGVTPVLCSVAVDGGGDLLNCNADTVAGAVAGATGASSLVLLSDVDQLRSDADDAQSCLSSVTMDQVRSMIDDGSARDGMRPKMAAALDALGAGARRIVVANGTRRHALRDALSLSIPTTEVVR